MKKGFKIAYFHLQLYQSRLNFGKVDHVVDLAQQFFTALANQANEFLAFLGIDVGFGQQFGKTQNGVHGVRTSCERLAKKELLRRSLSSDFILYSSSSFFFSMASLRSLII